MMCPTLSLRLLNKVGEDRDFVGLRWLSRKPEELLALSMSVEKQAKALCVHAAKDGGHKGNATIVRAFICC